MRAGRQRFVRTYLISLVVILVVGLLAVVGIQAVRLVQPDFGKPRPTPAQLAPYRLSSSVAGGPIHVLTIDPDAKACDALAPSDFLRTVCTLALNEDPRFIAEEAFGDLNNRDTPAYEAIIWRARLESSQGLCDAGGLLGARLERCRSIASNSAPYVRTDGVVSVTVGQ